jgi:hypothetical protein
MRKGRDLASRLIDVGMRALIYFGLRCLVLPTLAGLGIRSKAKEMNASRRNRFKRHH